MISEERHVALKNGRTVLLRPARAADAAPLQHLIHEMTATDVYTRFFRRLRSLSYEDAQRLCNVNHNSEVAFIATVGPRENEKIVGSSCYFLNPTTNLAESAFMVLPEWQGTGLGSALQTRMIEFAKVRGIKGFTSEILTGNTKMVSLARKCCDTVKIERDGDTYHVVMIF